MPKRTLAPEYREDYLQRLRELIESGRTPMLIRLWVNREGSSCDVKIVAADSRGTGVVNITPWIAYLMNEPLWKRDPEGWALRLSCGGVSPAAIVEDYLRRAVDAGGWSIPSDAPRVVES